MEEEPISPTVEEASPPDWQDALAKEIPKIVDLVDSKVRHGQRMKYVNRGLYLVVLLLILGTVVYLAQIEVIDGATTGTVIGAIVGYTLGAIKEGFYD